MKKGAHKKKKITAKKENYFKKGFFIIRIIISIILSFLPSFIYVALFVQYGSPFLNYIKFLSNLNSSWGAWLSAIIIVFLVNFIWRIIKSKEHFRAVIKNKVLLAILILCLVAVLALISIQLYLYINFTLRNDILVKLSADKDNLFFTNNSNEDVTFKISVIRNPFCSVQCEYEFFDISGGKEIETGFFNLASVLPKFKTYTINNSNLVQGSQVLNRFEVSCKSKKTLLCYTKEEESKRAVLVTLNYELNSEDAEFKNNSREEIIALGKTLYSADGKLNESARNIDSINDSFSTEIFSQQLKDLSTVFTELNESFKNLGELWEIQNFSLLKSELPDTKNKIQNLDVESERLNSDIILNISFYNNLTENLTNSKQILEQISQMSLSSSLCDELNKAISDFNEAIQKFKEKTNISDKKLLVENIFLEIEELYKKSQNNADVGSSCFLKEKITNENLAKIKIISIDQPVPIISLNEPTPICCFLGDCEKCCDNSCSGENYPLIFLHGHSINKALSADYSLDAFTNIKEKLTEGNYIDAGAVIISSVTEQKGLWGKVNVPIMVTASYFFDIYKIGKEEKTVSSNTDSIDTYAIRLKDIVDLVKYRTNKDKVIIVAHSMGGVVTRRYIQIFGGLDVDKAILIDVPNHGVDDKVRDFCSVLGPEVACNELDKDSLFMNKLNNAPTRKVPIYNIIGIGCDMGNETGDGIIKSSNQYLDYATNYYATGTCNELNFEFFHETILYSDRYPGVYDIIYKIIEYNNISNS